MRFLKSQGFVEDRQAGSHLTLWHPERRLAVTVPVHTGTDLGRGLAVRILKDAGFHRRRSLAAQMNSPSGRVLAFRPLAAPWRWKAVNPHAKRDDDLRTPEELLDIIEAKAREVAEAIAALRTITSGS